MQFIYKGPILRDHVDENIFVLQIHVTARCVLEIEFKTDWKVTHEFILTWGNYSKLKESNKLTTQCSPPPIYCWIYREKSAHWVAGGCWVYACGISIWQRQPDFAGSIFFPFTAGQELFYSKLRTNWVRRKESLFFISWHETAAGVVDEDLLIPNTVGHGHQQS